MSADTTTFRTLPELADYLETKYAPRCIGRGEAPNEAHRYAGKVELASDLVRKIRGRDSLFEDDPDVTSVEVT
jgi:hypothetical protein